MSVEQSFQQLERDASLPSAGAKVYRRMLPQRPFDLSLQVERAGLRRSIRIASAGAPYRLPDKLNLRGIAVSCGRTERSMSVALMEPQLAELFSTLLEDLLSSVSAVPDGGDPVSVALQRLRLWQRLFADGRQTVLSPGEQRGLFAELACLADIALPALGSVESVDAWIGPLRAPQDFAIRTVSIEVKSRLRRGGQSVRISSEDQLRSAPGSRLFLVVVALDPSTGRTLPQMVGELRGRVSDTPIASVAFEDKLLQAGYLDLHAAQYAATAYAYTLDCYEVRDAFPRIVPPNLSRGLSNVAYDLSIAACVPFAVGSGDLLGALGGGR